MIDSKEVEDEVFLMIEWSAKKLRWKNGSGRRQLRAKQGRRSRLIDIRQHRTWTASWLVTTSIKGALQPAPLAETADDPSFRAAEGSNEPRYGERNVVDLQHACEPRVHGDKHRSICWRDSQVPRPRHEIKRGQREPGGVNVRLMRQWEGGKEDFSI